jgi:hypothetical protein
VDADRVSDSAANCKGVCIIAPNAARAGDFQNNSGDILRAALELGAAAVSASPVVQLRPCAHDPHLRFGVGVSEVNYDVTADGARFLTRFDPQDSLPSSVTVVVNWQSKLR